MKSLYTLSDTGSTPVRSTKDATLKRGIRSAILALVSCSDYRTSEGSISVFGGPAKVSTAVEWGDGHHVLTWHTYSRHVNHNCYD